MHGPIALSPPTAEHARPLHDPASRAQITTAVDLPANGLRERPSSIFSLPKTQSRPIRSSPNPAM
jgi:hypothetical protein